MSEHTPGPWHVEGRLVADADGDIVANEIDSRESLNLIAAAPDMEKALVVMGELLVAAEEFMVSYHSNVIDIDIRIRLEAAIRKAKGLDGGTTQC